MWPGDKAMYEAQCLFHVHHFSLVALEITSHPEDQNVSLSDEYVMLHCSAAGFPAPKHVIWFHNGSQLQNVVPFYEVTDNHTIASTLIIPLVGGNSTGSYFCRATTTYKAVDSNSAYVFFQGK